MVFGKMGDMVKMAREMQKQLKQVKNELKHAVYKASDGGVDVVVNGEMEIKEVKIDPLALDPGKNGQLEKAVKNAVNRAVEIAKEDAARKMKHISGGMGLPEEI